MTSETFFKELNRLIRSLPKSPSNVFNSESCEFGNNILYSKNLYYCFECANCTDSSYLFDCYMCANCIDCDYTVESELCYECVDAFKCFNCDYLENCAHMRDSSYSYSCVGCHDVFGCVSLTNKSFCIFNRQLTEEEYKQQVKKYKALPSEKILVMVEELKKRYPWTQTNEAHNENSEYGDYIYYNKNCYLCFDAAHDENCGYLYDSFYNKTCYDMTYGGQNVELSYQIVDSARIFNCNYVINSNNCQESSYLLNCFDVKNSLGCVGLSHKQYCILNRQFEKEEYEKVSKQIFDEFISKNVEWNDIKI